MKVDVRIRPVRDEDLPIFAHQADPVASAMADFPSRDRAAFDAHWAKIRQVPTGVLRTVIRGEEVAGNVVSWLGDGGRRFVGYWIGREHWGRGVATRALALFIGEVAERPLFADVARSNAASIHVLEKAGFERAGEDDGALLYRFA